MFREQSRLIERIHRLLDILLTVAAFGAAYFIKRDLLPEPFRGLITAPNYHVVLLLIHFQAGNERRGEIIQRTR